MAATRIRVDGAARLEATLKGAADSLDDLKDLHAQVGALVARGGERNAPRESGRLAGSIRASGTKSASVVRAGGSSIPYAGVQEFGWPARGIPASPYLTTSLEENEPAILDLYEAEVDRVLGTVKGT